MKGKKLISAILAIAILMAQFSWLSFAMPTVVNAQEATTTNIADKYFYNQLDADAKAFYNIMDKMFFGCNYAELKKIQILE